MYLSLFNKSVQMAGNAIITNRWNYRHYKKKKKKAARCKQSSLFGRRVLLSFCCHQLDYVFEVSLSLKYLFGCLRLSPCYYMFCFVADEMVKVGLRENNSLEEEASAASRNTARSRTKMIPPVLHANESLPGAKTKTD